MTDDLITALFTAHGIPQPEREYRFHATRRWRFDFSWPGLRVALEKEGATWVQGRHTRGKGYESDCEKYSNAAADGWLVIRGTTGQFKSGVVFDWLKRALYQRGG